MKIGDNVGISQTSIECHQNINIGNDVLIGAGCLIIDSNCHSSDWRIRKERINDVACANKAPIKICDNVFIGAKSIICKGVTIGERSIIAAGSVVVTDIPADCIAGGNPCKVVKKISNA